MWTGAPGGDAGCSRRCARSHRPSTPWGRCPTPGCRACSSRPTVPRPRPRRGRVPRRAPVRGRRAARRPARAKPAPLGSVLLQPLGGAFARVPAGATALGRRSAPWAWQAGAAWFDPAADAAVEAWFDGLYTRRSRRGRPARAGRTSSPAATRTGCARPTATTAWARLQSIRAAWDPDDVLGRRPRDPAALVPARGRPASSHPVLARRGSESRRRARHGARRVTPRPAAARAGRAVAAHDGRHAYRPDPGPVLASGCGRCRSPARPARLFKTPDRRPRGRDQPVRRAGRRQLDLHSPGQARRVPARPRPTRAPTCRTGSYVGGIGISRRRSPHRRPLPAPRSRALARPRRSDPRQRRGRRARSRSSARHR